MTYTTRWFYLQRKHLCCMLVVGMLLVLLRSTHHVIELRKANGEEIKRISKPANVGRDIFNMMTDEVDRRLIVLVKSSMSISSDDFLQKLLLRHPHVIYLNRDTLGPRNIEVLKEDKFWMVRKIIDIFSCNENSLSSLVDYANDNKLFEDDIPWCGSRVNFKRTFGSRSSSEGVQNSKDFTYCNPAPKSKFEKLCYGKTLAIQLKDTELNLLCDLLPETRKLRIVLFGDTNWNCDVDLQKVDSSKCSECMKLDAKRTIYETNISADDSTVKELFNFLDLYNPNNF